MPRMSHSAAILDEADSTQRKLDWVLFKQEQEKILYGGKPHEWEPGDSLFVHPWVREMELEPIYDEAYADEDDDEDGIQNVRPMFQIIHDFAWARCKDCQVYWRGESNDCWICGKTVIMSSQTANLYNWLTRAMRQDMESAWLNAFRAMLGVGVAADGASRVMQRLMAIPSPSQRMVGPMQGFTINPCNVVVDEWASDPIVWYADRDIAITRDMIFFDVETVDLFPVVRPFRVPTPAGTVYERSEARMEATENMLWAFRQRRATEPSVEVGDAASRQRAVERVSDRWRLQRRVTEQRPEWGRRRDGR